MPIAPHKWQRRQARCATDQREKARSRLIGGPLDRARLRRELMQRGDWLGLEQGFMTINTVRQQYTYTTVQPITFTINPIICYQTGSALMNSQQAVDNWGQWVNGTTITTAGPDNQVWYEWVEADRLTTEEMEAAERRRIEHREQIAAAAKAAEEADARAMALFLEMLTPDQRADYDGDKHIEVIGSRGRRYWILCRNSMSGNVLWMFDDDSTAFRATLCCHPSERVPLADAWLAQKLMLETDEDAFTALANYSGAARPAPMEIEVVVEESVDEIVLELGRRSRRAALAA